MGVVEDGDEAIRYMASARPGARVFVPMNVDRTADLSIQRSKESAPEQAEPVTEPKKEKFIFPVSQPNKVHTDASTIPLHQLLHPEAACGLCGGQLPEDHKILWARDPSGQVVSVCEPCSHRPTVVMEEKQV